MELQHIQRNGVENLVDFTATGVHEQTYRRDEWGQRGNDLARPLQADRTRAFAIENQPDGIGAGFGRDQRIFNPGYAANLAANDWQRSLPIYRETGW